MRKGFLMVLAVVLVAAMAAPAMADLTTSGFVRIKGHVEQNYRPGAPLGGAGGLFILPGKDAPTAAYVEQRQRFILDWKGENVGARGYFEIDFGRWGDSSYTVGRNQGAGLEGDSINLETKNFFMWFNVPNTSVKVTAGLQNVSDSFGGMIIGYADMAGIVLTGKAEPVSYRLGWVKWQEGDIFSDDDVDFYIAEAKFAPSKDAKVGIDFYVLRDASGAAPVSQSGATGTNLNTLGRGHSDYGFAASAFTYKPATFYYIGVDGAVQAGPVKLSGYGFYNFGKIDLLGGTFAGDPVGAGTSIDVKAFAADVRAEMAAGPGKAFIEAAYVSGSSESDEDLKAPIVGGNYALAANFSLTSMDMQILFNSLDDINASAALAYDVQNKGRGIIAVAAGYRMKFNDMLSGKVGIGYLADAKNSVGSNVSGVAIKKHSATEINANVNYEMVKGLNLGLYGAYAFLTDWEDYGSHTITAANMTQDADDIFKTYFRMNYAF